MTQHEPEYAEQDTCRDVQVDGETIRVRGSEDLTPEGQEALTALVRAAKATLVAEAPDQVGVLQNRLRLAHKARRAKERQLEVIRRALCDAGFMEDDDPYSYADLADVIRQAGEAVQADSGRLRERLRLLTDEKVANVVGPNIDLLCTELERARAEVAAARKFAGEMRDFCSPHAVAAGYADQLEAAMDRAKGEHRDAAADTLAAEWHRRHQRLEELTKSKGPEAQVAIVEHVRGELVGLRGALGVLLGGQVQDGTADLLGWSYYQEWRRRQEEGR